MAELNVNHLTGHDITEEPLSAGMGHRVRSLQAGFRGAMRNDARSQAAA
jgi:hypothetical protein